MSLKEHKNRQRAGEAQGANQDSWLQTYSDMITLLMSFFVVLIAVSKVDPLLWEQIKKGLRSEILEEDVKTPLAEIKYDLDSLLAEEKEKGLVAINYDENGIWLTFASSAFYSPGSADVGEDAQLIIGKVTQAIKKIDYYPFKIDVEGHTDNVPISTVRFPSNWELSVARATNIVKYMIDQEISSDRLKAAGYADTKPVVPNVDSTSGMSIPENQAANRRILILIR